MSLNNSRNSNYAFEFPKGWLFPAVREAFEPALDRFEIPFASIEDYLNYTVQSVSFPNMNPETVSQSLKEVDKFFKGGQDGKRYYEHDFQVTFSSKEGYINYLIMQMQWEKFWSHGKDDIPYVPDIRMGILDQDEYQIMSVTFKEVVFEKLSL